MNWPQLSPECSKVLAEAMKDALHSKPKDLFEHVAQKLQDRSGLDPAEFKARFEECKRKPRTYVLEESCPLGQDPIAWVPMRYNDDTILSTLRQRAAELTSDVLHHEPLEDTASFLNSACVAFPELTYLRDSAQELVAFQTLRSIYFGCSGCPDVVEHGLDDADPALSFRCGALVEFAREQLFEAASQNNADLDALIVFCILRILGDHGGFTKRYGRALSTPESAVLHAIENEPQSLPSYQRLAEGHQELIVSVLKIYFPLASLVSSEVAPAHFLQVKEALTQSEGGLAFFLAAIATEHMVKSRNILVTDEAVDLLRVGTENLASVEKYSASRAYELFLKKRAERHAWRLVKDDYMQRAIVRLCCFAGQEDDHAWSEVMKTVDDLPHHEKDVLKTELGRKDGLTWSPVYVPLGGSALLIEASANRQLTLRSAVRLLIRVFEDAARTFDRVLNQRMVKLRLEGFAMRARTYTGGGPFEDIPFRFEELGPGLVAVHMAGEGS